ncbi:hypothetical protein LCGC14_1425370 [marine sediment metagenome]|uniref:Uncharacterized protein n=1 Tax=marine sediment metagenome TaxID=412755 RepID=A0A0F9KBA3_9ZZZZ
MIHKAKQEPFLTEAHKQHLDEGNRLYFLDYIEVDDDGIFMVDSVKHIYLPAVPYSQIMRHDKYIEEIEYRKLYRFVDEWGYVPYELQ